MKVDQVDIVCWKWNAGLHPKKKMIFGADHVNILGSMLARHVHLPYRFTCITDDPAGIDPSIRVLPLWDDFRWKGGCFCRLKAFSSEMKRVIGPRICSIDLDTVIVDDITPILRRPEEFVVWGDPARATPYCGSFWIMTAGCREEVWTGFEHMKYLPNAHGKYKRGTDQARISDALYPRERVLGKEEGIYNFERDLKVSATMDTLLGKLTESRTQRASKLEQDLHRAHQQEVYRLQQEGTNPDEKQITDILNGVTEEVIRKSHTLQVKVEAEFRRRISQEKRRQGRRGGSTRGKLMSNARIVFFNGQWDPNNKLLQRTYPWIKEHYR